MIGYAGSSPKKIVAITIIRAFAVLLVINSHLDTLYPIAALATGGALGNALFFASAGFCLIDIQDDFGVWYWKKIKKLYLPIWIMSFILLIFREKNINNFLEAIRFFLWPTTYWFVGAMVLFYIGYYFIVKKNFHQRFYVMTVILLVLYIIIYVFVLDTSSWIIETPGLNSIAGSFKLIYYFFIMLMGAYFANNIKKIKSSKWYLFGIMLSISVLYGAKWFMMKNTILMHWQFSNQVCIILFTFCTFRYVISQQVRVEKIQDSKIFLLLLFLSNYAFEIYLTQFFVIKSMTSFVFPFSILLAFLLICFAAYLLRIFENILRKKME